jgi:hypothetical protein
MSSAAAPETLRRRWGMSWIALCFALAVHVFDEATTGFLELWNPTVSALRQRVPLLPLPTFDFATWLAGLIAGIAVLFALSYFVFRGAPWIRPFAYGLAILMIGNGLAHIAASVYLSLPAPGVLSAPLLLAAAGALLVSTRRYHVTEREARS